MIGLTANKGLFQTKYKNNADSRQSNFWFVRDIFLTEDMPYHWFYLLICFLGLVGHDFLYCILVGVVLGVV